MLVNEKFIRGLGFQYHAIGKYFFKTIGTTTVILKKSLLGAQLVYVAAHSTDPREYFGQEGKVVLLLCDPSQETLTKLLEVLSEED